MVNNTPAVAIRARRDGFWRCGVAHPAARTVYEKGHWSEEQLEALLAEPALVVERADDEPPPPPGPEIDPVIAGIAARIDRRHLEALADLDAAEREALLFPARPDAPARLGMLAAAVGVPRLGETDFGKDGRPHVRAMERVTGTDWTPEERDEAWAALPQLAERLAAALGGADKDA